MNPAHNFRRHSVLYSGFCGAVLFGKVLRIQSHAQVIFSDPLLIRFGEGITSDASAAPERNPGEVGNRPVVRCPILEFRIVNRLFDEAGGEILDASLNVVANINANDAHPIRDEAASLNRGTSRSNNKGGTGSSQLSQFSTRSGDAMSDDSTMRESSIGRIIGKIGQSLHNHVIDEDPSARIVNKFVFSKMTIEASEHPFFRRVWVARHVLDEHSPILKDKVRRQIRRHGGMWPEKLSNATAIRECLQFNQILVSLTGVSNVSAADVYAQKI
jgi:hypothetical protein